MIIYENIFENVLDVPNHSGSYVTYTVPCHSFGRVTGPNPHTLFTLPLE